MDDATTKAHGAALEAAFSAEAWKKLDREAPEGDWINGVPGRRFRIWRSPMMPVLGTTFDLDVGGALVPVPNFVLPSWYVPGSIGPWDMGGKLQGPQSVTPNGYYVADDEGRVHEVWSHPSGRAAFAAAAADKDHMTAIAVSMIEADQRGVPWKDHHEERFAPPPAPPEPTPESPVSDS